MPNDSSIQDGLIELSAWASSPRPVQEPLKGGWALPPQELCAVLKGVASAETGTPASSVHLHAPRSVESGAQEHCGVMATVFRELHLSFCSNLPSSTSLKIQYFSHFYHLCS